MNRLRNAGIIGTGSYLPERIMTNQDLEKLVDTSDEWIKSRTGIEERRIADKDTATSDLGTKAALLALENAGLEASELDMIIVATVTPDMSFPSTACIIQKNIGAVNAAAFDLEAACTGFLYGLVLAENLIKAGNYKHILVIGAETLSKIVDYTDRNTCVLFADGAGAVVVSEVPEGYGILSSTLGADGSNGDSLTHPAGGSRLPASQDTLRDRLHFIKMSGKDVFKFAVRAMDSATDKVLADSGKTKEDIDFLIPHQANIRIIDAALKRLNISQEKTYLIIKKCGNISSASIPVALDEANRKGLLKDGAFIVLVGFGGGLTWGAAAMNWKDIRR